MEIDLSKPEDRHRLKTIREDAPSRSIDFTVRLIADSPVRKVTAGCRRNPAWTLQPQRKDGYPYVYQGGDKTLNYVFGYKEGQLNDNKIPSGGPSYQELMF